MCIDKSNPIKNEAQNRNAEIALHSTDSFIEALHWCVHILTAAFILETKKCQHKNWVISVTHEWIKMEFQWKIHKNQFQATKKTEFLFVVHDLNNNFWRNQIIFRKFF